MKVRIIKSKTSTYWYSRNIGSVYVVQEMDHDGDYCIISGPGYWDRLSGDYRFNVNGHYISGEDCEVIENENKWGQSKLEFKFV